MIKIGKYYITSTPDCGENEGGLFCQVYTDRACDNEIDNFCVHKDENIMDVIKQNIKDIERNKK